MSKMGFRLARSKGMEGSTGNLHEYPIAPGNTTAIFKGDLVTLNGGNIEVSDGAAGKKVLGIFWGCKYIAADGSVEFRNHWDGGAGRSKCVAMVAVMPVGATMLVGCDVAAAYTAADVGTLKAVDATTAGDARTGQSRQILGAPGASVATAPLIVLKFFDKHMEEITPAKVGDAHWAEVSLAAANAVELAGAA